MSAGTQKRAAALREQLEEQGHYVEDATSPLFEQRVLAHVKDAHLLEGPPDLRKAKQVAPPVPPRAEARQVTQKAADSAAASAPAAVAGPTAKPAGTSAPDASNDSLPFVSVEQSRMLKDLDEIMMEGFEAIYWADGIYIIPGFPKNAKKAAQLQSQVDQLIEQGDAFEAFPWQVQMAMYSWHVLGEDHPETLRAMYSMCQTMFTSRSWRPHLLLWTLARAARQWGVAHPDVRVLVDWAGDALAQIPDPRHHTGLAHVTHQIAQQLPGGLGWGTCGMGPIDFGAYGKHGVLQQQAFELSHEGYDNKDFRVLKLARDMFARCVAYFESLGPHWLASPRKFRCLQLMAPCVGEIEGKEAAEKLLADARRAAQRELGASHRMTLMVTWAYAQSLQGTGREGAQEKAMSLFQKVLRLRKDVYGPHHHLIFETEVEMAKIFMEVGRYEEALALAKHVFEDGYKALGQIDSTVMEGLRMYYICLKDHLGKPDEAAALRKRATGLGYKSGLWSS